MESTCPICSKQVPSSILERHVNGCLDNQEASVVDLTPENEVVQISEAKTQNDPSDENQIVEIDNIKHDYAVVMPNSTLSPPPEPSLKRRKPSNDAFAALGLKMDSSQKRQKLEKIQKSKPTLTRILIEERRIKAESKRQTEKFDTSSEDLEKLSKTFVDEEETAQPDVEEIIEESAEDQLIIKDEIKEIQDTPLQDTKQEHEQSPRQSDILTKAQELNKLKREASIPLAHRLRPKSLDDFYGQEKLLGKNGLLRNIINADNIQSFILWGVPGVGKTSLARIIAHTTSCKFVELSGADSNAKKLKEVFVHAEHEKHLTGRKTILFLDEIHRFNKAVQDLLLPVIEKGVITVIGATTENPSFTLNNALLSRMHTFVMEKLTSEAIVKILARALYQVNKLRKNLYNLHYISLKKDAYNYIAELSMGDSRVALNILESINAYLSTDKFSTLEKGEEGITQSVKMGVVNISADMLKPLLKTRNFHNMYDKQGESHYDTISAFHKSVRGSDADAAMFYLVKMLSGGEDPLFIVRRMIVMASEDIGLRDSSCLPFAIAAKEALEFVGMPEGEIILAHCAMKMARAPKSTKSYRALRTAQSLLKEKPEITKLPIPMHIRNAPTKLMKELGYGDAYKYNPNYKYGRVKQTYFPPGMDSEDTKFMEDTHLGNIEDEEVASKEYEKMKEEDEEYQAFKKTKLKLLKEDYLESIKQSKLKNRRSLSKAAESLIKKATRASSSSAATASYSYDEFLSKEDQPEYFEEDGEIGEQSDDPDCSNNFEKSYDEFLDPDSQPEYFDGGEASHYEPEYPIEGGDD
ncbi:DNA-dependent ATPase [Scheffersomyces xylosifermentans]|uniref:DNA-dependent ATPase n=1 Tax=Scheffersomyces xylosifermentans TaxID=1304137 RepID=UPI00315DEC45